MRLVCASSSRQIGGRHNNAWQICELLICTHTNDSAAGQWAREGAKWRHLLEVPSKAPHKAKDLPSGGCLHLQTGHLERPLRTGHLFPVRVSLADMLLFPWPQKNICLGKLR